MTLPARGSSLPLGGPLGAKHFAPCFGKGEKLLARVLVGQVGQLPLEHVGTIAHRASQGARFQNGSFGGGPGHRGVAQGLIQSTVPEQRVVKHPVHPVPEVGDRRILVPVHDADRGGDGGGGRSPRPLQHAGGVLGLVEGGGGVRQGPDAGLGLQQRLALREAQLGLAAARPSPEQGRLALLRRRLQAAAGPLRRLLLLLLGGGGGGLGGAGRGAAARQRVRMRVREGPPHLALGALRLGGVQILQVAELQLLLLLARGLCGWGRGRGRQKQDTRSRAAALPPGAPTARPEAAGARPPRGKPAAEPPRPSR